MPDRVAAFAPASIGNLGVGFDVLGLALEGVGDRVIAERSEVNGVRIKEVRGLDGELHPYLSTDPKSNTASIAAAALWQDHGHGGVRISIHKGVPLQSGMGSSAASAVAAVVAVNALLDAPLPIDALLPYALEGEKFASGGLHADNVAPSLLGGMILCPEVLLPATVRIASPNGVSAVLLHPELAVNTREARQQLRPTVPLRDWIAQQGYLAGFIAACQSSDVELIGRTLRDIVIEPQRAANVSCFGAVREAALESGALGVSLSGSGPSIFALCRDSEGVTLAARMEQACHEAGIECQSWVSPMDAPGARVESI
jgi:homoserine kinase